MACYSFSGALGDTTWMVPGNEPLVSIHEVGDGVVPYYTAPVYVIGIPTGLTASGSHDIHIRADNLGLVNCFKSYPGNGHVGYLSSDFNVAMDYVSLFMGELVCGAPVTCGISTSVAEVTTEAAHASPNPTTGMTWFQMASPGVVVVRDMSGRAVLDQRFGAGRVALDLSALPAGAYTVGSTDGTVPAFRVLRID
ncbi:MAG: T9SS type A sorting domain-containing protein [Flavobacteriales bacterium]|nr:T9SS type A sorting domain-containing protein [Flavobacteriales bacterium]